MKRARYVIILISVIVISLYIRQISQRDIEDKRIYVYRTKKQTYSDDISNGFIATPIIFDSDTMENLSNFRIEQKLINEFPTTFYMFKHYAQKSCPYL